jgi:hypothetical protein
MDHTTSPRPGGGDPNRVRRYGTKHGCANLADDVTLWATPNAPNGGRTLPEEDVLAKGATENGKRQVGLEMQARYFPTPAARDYRSPNKKPYQDRGGQNKGEQLVNFVEHCLTSPQGRPIGDGQISSPSARNFRQHFAISTGSFLHVEKLVYCRWAWNATQRLWARPYVRPCLRPKLNAGFASWLMGWPPGLASALHPCGSLEMESWLNAQRSHLRRLLGEPESTWRNHDERAD